MGENRFSALRRDSGMDFALSCILGVPQTRIRVEFLHKKGGPAFTPTKNIFGYIKGFPKIGVFLNHRFGGISIYGNSHLVSSFRHELGRPWSSPPEPPRTGLGRACPVTLPGSSVSGTEERWKNLWGFLKSWYPKMDDL